MGLTLARVSAVITGVRPIHVCSLAAGYITYQLIHRLILWPRFFSPLRRLPTLPGTNPFLGHLPALINDENGAKQREWVKKYGPVIRFFGPFGWEHLLIADSQHLHKILAKDSSDFPKPAHLRHILGIVSGYGLLTVTGNEHHLMKKAISPAFSLPSLISQMQSYHGVIERLVKLLNDQIRSQDKPHKGRVMPVYKLMTKTSFDIICVAAFDYEANSLHDPHNELAEAYQNLLSLQDRTRFVTFFSLLLIPGISTVLASSWMYRNRSWLAITKFSDRLRILIECMHTIKTLAARLLQEKLDDSVSEPHEEATRNMMSVLIRSQKRTIAKDYVITDDAMVDQALTFLGAGHETMASALTWVLWLLANDQDSQTKLREEVAPVLGSNSCPDYRTLKKLRWLDCVIMECLRIMPPAPVTLRIANKTDYVGDILVPKGTMIYVPIGVVNTDKRTWGEDSELFKPSRWLSLPEEYNPNHSLLSFITGQHGCIGKTMAIMEMKTVIAHLITHFNFQLAYDGQAAKPSTAFTMKPSDGMPLLVTLVK